jgi:hypothetical protein
MGESRKAVIAQALCIGCGECTAVCPADAIPIRWKAEASIVQEKTAEYALAALQGKRERCGFYNFLNHISPDCDCFGWNDAAIAPDIGILASRDPVAIDQASALLLQKAPGLPNSKLKNLGAEDKIREVTGVDWEPILKYGERIGLGSRSFKQITVR